jgi:hypothetical protein
MMQVIYAISQFLLDDEKQEGYNSPLFSYIKPQGGFHWTSRIVAA